MHDGLTAVMVEVFHCFPVHNGLGGGNSAAICVTTVYCILRGGRGTLGDERGALHGSLHVSSFSYCFRIASSFVAPSHVPTPDCYN